MEWVLYKTLAAKHLRKELGLLNVKKAAIKPFKKIEWPRISVLPVREYYIFPKVHKYKVYKHKVGTKFIIRKVQVCERIKVRLNYRIKLDKEEYHIVDRRYKWFKE